MAGTLIKAPGKFSALTSLRFVAAAMVVVTHSSGHFGIPQHFSYPFVLGQAVAFFFVLSGFILAYVYPSLERKDIGPFLRARVARIWPAHLFCFVLFCFIISPFSAFSNLNSLLGVTGANLFLVHSWIPWPKVNGAFNAPTWSISAEWFFYLCFPFLIHRFERNWP
ncbi:MAG: acyltransferase, partial [Verrucomicrobiota bacterium]